MSFFNLNDDVKSIITKHLSSDYKINKIFMTKPDAYVCIYIHTYVCMYVNIHSQKFLRIFGENFWWTKRPGSPVLRGQACLELTYL
jgi:hypothetical protein